MGRRRRRGRGRSRRKSFAGKCFAKNVHII